MEFDVKYVVVEFTPPEGDYDGTFDSIVGIYDSELEAELEAAKHVCASVYKAPYKMVGR